MRRLTIVLMLASGCVANAPSTPANEHAVEKGVAANPTLPSGGQLASSASASAPTNDAPVAITPTDPGDTDGPIVPADINPNKLRPPPPIKTR
jgi:hypothetical protein